MYLLGDIDGLPKTTFKCSFEELCESFWRSGIDFHLVSSKIETFELQLFESCLKVTVYCVSASVSRNKSPVLRQQSGTNASLRRVPLSGTPVGVLVFRYKRRFQCGHYQIVRAVSPPCSALNRTNNNGLS